MVGCVCLFYLIAEVSQGEVLRKVIGDLEVIEDEAVHGKVKVSDP